MILLKLDLTKIDKSKLFEGKNGAKYLDVILIDSPGSKYGDDYMAVQGVTKEEREAGVKGAILGNAKIHGKKPAGQTNGNQPARRTSAPPAKQPADSGLEWDGNDDNIPF